MRNDALGAKVRTVGFICPMDCELYAVTRLFDEKKTVRYGGLDFYEGVIAQRRAVAVKCGVGKVFAAFAAAALILGFSPDLIINTGFPSAMLWCRALWFSTIWTHPLSGTLWG